jgi:glutamyl-tRNA synthetase
LALGATPARVRGELAAGVGLADPGQEPGMDELLRRFDPDALPTDPTVLEAA